MKFSKALELLDNGKKVRLLLWEKDFYLSAINGVLVSPSGDPYPLEKFHPQAFLCLEWQEYIEPQVYFDLEKACHYLKLGYKLRRKAWGSGWIQLRGSLIVDELNAEYTKLLYSDDWHLCDVYGNYVCEPKK